MPSRDIIVMGASAGGIESLRSVLGNLPKDLPAAVLIVLHISPDHRSVLPRILDAAGPLPAAHAADGERLEHGRVYVAPPNRHLVVDDGVVRLTRSPREGGHRPAVDPLFRTAARFHGARVIGVVLSGALDDGTAGLLAVKQRGGVAVVQDPDDALCGDMPRSALENVDVDYCLPVSAIPDLLEKLLREPVELHSPIPPLLLRETDIALERNPSDENAPGKPSEFACPSCGGVLNEVHDGKVLRFRCRVGHAYGVASLTADQQDKMEAALWAALRALEDQIALNRRLARRAEERGHRYTAETFRRYEESALEQANTIRGALNKTTNGVPESVPARDPA
ncbi:MAG TPA: chemotaxis protein CheB [Myxococcales bacterium]|jgi:two-component system chemotaxis response regulator CheB|nr:chemotaxis protein CheB [Myxococcales bacterium]